MIAISIFWEYDNSICFYPYSKKQLFFLLVYLLRPLCYIAPNIFLLYLFTKLNFFSA